MPKVISAREGDCFINLCKQEGFFWETVWNHPQNDALRRQRKQLNIVKKGDKIYIPDLELKEYPSETERRHTFYLNGATVKFTLTLMNLGKPRADENYTLKVEGKTLNGRTDENGTLTEQIPAKARFGLLLLGEEKEEITVNFGFIDPLDEISGVQRRLQNLGFYDGEIDDQLNEDTKAALAEFQRSVELAGEGELTDETRQKLREVHGS